MGSIELSHNQRTSADLLDTEIHRGFVNELLNAAVYSGVEKHARGIAQIVDQHAATKFDENVKSAFKAVGVQEPEPVQFNTSNWYAQQIGGTAGMIAPFVLLRGAVKSVAGGAVEQAASRIESKIAQTAFSEASYAAGAGMLYGTVLNPSKESNVGSAAFYKDRLLNGLADAATFASLSGMSPFISRGLVAAVAPLDSLAINPTIKAALDITSKSPITSGIVAGVPGGIASAEINAWRDGRAYASLSEIHENVVGMSFMGATVGTANLIASKNIGSPSVRELDPKAMQKAFTRIQDELKAAGLLPDVQDPALAGRALDTKLAAARENGASGANSTALLKDLGLLERKGVLASGLPSAEIIADATRKVLGPSLDAKVAAGEVKAPAPTEKSVGQAGGISDKVAIAAAPKDAAKVGSDALAGKGEGQGFDVVLGASGVEAPAHVGFLKALEERNIKVKNVYGASGGALIATLYTNGFSPTKLNNLLLSDDFRVPSTSVLARCFHLTDPWNLFPYTIDFKPWLEDIVSKHGLKPQDNLKIVAADAVTKQPVVFEGKDYDLPTALAASTAAVTIGMKPVLYNGRQLVDGVYYHPIPAALATAPALVSKIGFASQFPTTVLSPWDQIMHMREMMLSSYLNSKFPDPEGHIISHTGLNDVSTSSFGVGPETLKRLVNNGRDATLNRLNQTDAIEAIKKRNGQS